MGMSSEVSGLMSKHKQEGVPTHHDFFPGKFLRFFTCSLILWTIVLCIISQLLIHERYRTMTSYRNFSFIGHKKFLFPWHQLIIMKQLGITCYMMNSLAVNYPLTFKSILIILGYKSLIFVYSIIVILLKMSKISLYMFNFFFFSPDILLSLLELLITAVNFFSPLFLPWFLKSSLFFIFFSQDANLSKNQPYYHFSYNRTFFKEFRLVERTFTNKSWCFNILQIWLQPIYLATDNGPSFRFSASTFK